MTTYSLFNKEWLKDRYYIQITAYYFREWNDYDMPFHTHNRVEIMYIVKGKCKVVTQDRCSTLKKGDFIIIDANVPHRLLVGKNEPCRILNIEYIFSKKSYATPSIRELASNLQIVQLLLNKPQQYLIMKDTEGIYTILRNLVMELDSENTQENNFLIQLLLTQILIKVSKIAVENKSKDTLTGSQYVKKACQYLQQHYDCDIQVKDVAKAVNIHEGYLHRIFKANTGYTVLEYLTYLRLEKAKMLLSNTDIPIIEISSYIGINSRQYFSYLFKKHIGLTPAQYRKKTDKFVGFDKS